jgi:GT2 family glycosyltransferase
VAVVIPTACRETRLAFALEALASQTLACERFEVVVVRAESPGPQAAAPDGLPVRFLSAAPGSSAGASRNIGWRATTAPLVAFTDDDCRPAPDWLERLLDAGSQDADLVLQGRTEPDPDEIMRLHGLARSQAIRGPSAWYETCNIAYPRTWLERVEGFDERFGGAYGEDADLGLRAAEAGAARAFVDDARVSHAVHSRHVWAAVREARRWNTIPMVVARHPAQRRALEFGLFWRAGHPRLLLAVAGALAFRRHRGLALAAATPYVREHMKGYPMRPRSLVRATLDLPARAIVDLAGVAITARAAIRHRTPVL